MENYKPPNPAGVCFFGAGTIAEKPDGASDLVQQLRWLWLTRRIAAFHQVQHCNSRTMPQPTESTRLPHEVFREIRDYLRYSRLFRGPALRGLIALRWLPQQHF